MAHKIGSTSRVRQFIRRHGIYKSVLASTVLLVLLVTAVALVIDLLIYQKVNPDPIYFSILLTLLTGPFFLYVFVSLIMQLDQSEKKLRALSIMDDLTDVYNRRYFLELAHKELAKASRYGTIFSLVAADIDHFKSINDGYGHVAGDAILKAMANTCMNNMRNMDIFARYGGEEFMFLIPESDKIDLEAFAERLLSACENTVVKSKNQEIHFTASIGIKSFDPQIRSLDSMLKEVGEALSEAKRSGGNCIVVCDSIVEFEAAS